MTNCVLDVARTFTEVPFGDSLNFVVLISSMGPDKELHRKVQRKMTTIALRSSLLTTITIAVIFLGSDYKALPRTAEQLVQFTVFVGEYTYSAFKIGIPSNDDVQNSHPPAGARLPHICIHIYIYLYTYV